MLDTMHLVQVREVSEQQDKVSEVETGQLILLPVEEVVVLELLDKMVLVRHLDQEALVLLAQLLELLLLEQLVEQELMAVLQL